MANSLHHIMFIALDVEKIITSISVYFDTFRHTRLHPVEEGAHGFNVSLNIDKINNSNSANLIRCKNLLAGIDALIHA